MKNWLMVLFIITGIQHTITAQAVWDTTVETNRHGGDVANFKAAPRLALGYNGAFIAEAGYAKSRLTVQWMMNNVLTRYMAVQWTANPQTKAGLWGLKAGGEIDFLFLHMGLELMLQTDFDNVKFFLLPNAGLTWFGTVGISYQWMRPLRKNNFPGTNPYQVMLKYNLTRELTREFKDAVIL